HHFALLLRSRHSLQESIDRRQQIGGRNSRIYSRGLARLSLHGGTQESVRRGREDFLLLSLLHRQVPDQYRRRRRNSAGCSAALDFSRRDHASNALKVRHHGDFLPSSEQTLYLFDNRPTDFHHQPRAGLERGVGLRNQTSN